MPTDDVRLMLGDCLDVLPRIESQSVDCIICDPPYPEISRPYGRMTEAEWHAMMRGVVAHARRILKPSGSAVFILQPNSEKVGRMRPWLFEFQAWTAREWNMVQDAYWWNTASMPLTKNDPNAMRASIKPCVWLGSPDCHHDASEVRWTESDISKASRQTERCYGKHNKVKSTRVNCKFDRIYMAAEANGGTTPFNLIPLPGGGPRNPSFGHGAQTPNDLCDWWVRYIAPEGGTVCDPFMGSGTTGLAALNRGRKFIGIERDPAYFATAQARIAAHRAATPLLTGVS